MATNTNVNTNNLSTDVTMESLVAEIRNLKVELTALQTQESFQNLSLDERGRERSHSSHPQSRPHNTKIQYFSNLPGENFLAWRSQFQVITDYHRWTDAEAKQLVYAYMKGTALESVMDITLTGRETVGQVLDEYQNRLLPESDSQLLRAQFACLVQLPNKSVQKLHARMRVLYNLTYPDASMRNEIFLIERFISALNNREVQNYVRCWKPPTYAKALHVANEETSLVLMDLATHAPGGLQAPTPGDTSFIAALKARRTESGKASTTRHKCYYCDEEGHFKERCPAWLKDFLKQRTERGSRRAPRPLITNGRANRATSPAATKRKQVKFAEAAQTYPVEAEGCGKKRIAAIANDPDPSDAPECQDLLADVDLTTLDKGIVAALY